MTEIIKIRAIVATILDILAKIRKVKKAIPY